MIEIEKKWLLKTIPNFPPSVFKFVHELILIQYYLAPNERIRQTYNVKDRTTLWEHFFKNRLEDGSNIEHVKEISILEFNNYMLNNKGKNCISKTRHVYLDNFTNLHYEVDVFTDLSLIMLEIEFQDQYKSIAEADEKFTLPDEIKKFVIMDVTPFKEFSNYSLSQK